MRRRSLALCLVVANWLLLPASGRSWDGPASLFRRAPRGDDATAGTGASGGGVSVIAVAKADALMRRRSAASCASAAALYEAELTKAPDDAELQLKAADAINAELRIRTNANAILIGGTLDTPANKRLWAARAPRALALAESALARRGRSDVRALSVYADAFMFSCSSKGLVKQAVSGAGKQYKELAKALQVRRCARRGALGGGPPALTASLVGGGGDVRWCFALSRGVVLHWWRIAGFGRNRGWGGGRPPRPGRDGLELLVDHTHPQPTHRGEPPRVARRGPSTTARSATRCSLASTTSRRGPSATQGSRSRTSARRCAARPSRSATSTTTA